VTPRLTLTEDKVARLLAYGHDYKVIAAKLGMAEKTVSVHVVHIAQKLPNPDNLKAHTLVLLWAAHRRWLLERESAA
jgi:DNA-binding NarL/FixJ family response regulator